MTAMTAHRDAALTHVNEHISQLEAELQTLKEAAKTLKGAGTVQATITGGGRPMRASRRTTKPTSVRRGGRGNGRVSDGLLLATLQKMNGSSSIRLAEKCGISQETALRRLHALEQAGSVSREGERNKTRWFWREPVAA